MYVEIEKLKGWWRELRSVRRNVVGAAIIGTIIGAIVVDALLPKVAEKLTEPTVYTAQVAHAEEVPKKVLIRVHIDWTEERIKKEIREVFPEEPETMIRVAECESGLVPAAKGPTDDHGIFQVHVPSHRKHLAGVNLDDPKENIAFARFLYDNGGLAHWKASSGCWSL